MTENENRPLVPDWVDAREDGGWACGMDLVLELVQDTDRGLVLGVVAWLTPGQVRDLLPALAFFAREGRLPTKDDERLDIESMMVDAFRRVIKRDGIDKLLLGEEAQGDE